MRATAVLITKLEQYPQEILDSLPKFDEIIVETECKSVYRRYELALQAKNDLIYFQDDDCIIDVSALLKHYDGRLTNAITPHHQAFYAETGMTLVGWGCFFPKRMVDFKPYTDLYGVDSLLLSQADRVFTYLNQPHNTVVTDVHHLPSATAPDRMSTQGDHWTNLDQIRKSCLQIKQ